MPSWSGKSLGEAMGKFYADLDKVGRDLTGPEKRKITRQMARAAQPIARRAARADLGGDGAFSGWVRGKPIPLDTKIRNGRDNATLLTPTRESAGPWTVAEKGRNSAGGFRGLFQGPGANLKTGATMFNADGSVKVTRRRTRKARRNNGRTDGKETASDAIAAMERELPKIAAKGVLQVQRKRFDVSG